MNGCHRLVVAIAVLGAVCMAAPAAAPTPVSGPGGAHHRRLPAGRLRQLAARAVGGRLSQVLGQRFVIENRPGASSSIAAKSAARAPKDGYTLFLGTVAKVVNVAITPNLPFDFSKDFVPIGLAAIVPVMLVVHPSIGVNSMPELIELAK